MLARVLPSRLVLGVFAVLVVAGGLWADASARRGGSQVPAVTKDGRPNVQSDAALIVDSRDGTILYEKNPDKVRAIASTSKIFVAMVVRRKGMDLEAATEITEYDRRISRGGARTKLTVGRKYKNVDLLKAMLIASDNRAPSALTRAVGLDREQMIEAMGNLAIELGLTKTSFTDLSGLRGNESTAREMSVALRAALEDDVIREILTTRHVTIYSVDERPHAINYGNTNRVLHGGRFDVHGGKTGYTEAAGYCLILSATIARREVSCVFLGADGELTRYGDFHRVATWMTGNAPPPAAPVAPATTPAQGAPTDVVAAPAP